MIPDLSTATERLRSLVGNHADETRLAIDAGTLRAALQALEEHAHCEEALEDAEREGYASGYDAGYDDAVLAEEGR